MIDSVKVRMGAGRPGQNLKDASEFSRQAVTEGLWSQWVMIHKGCPTCAMMYCL